MNEIPHELNWVKARAECSIAHVFSALFTEIQDDVREANLVKMEHFPGYPVSPLEVSSSTNGDIFVVFEAGNVATTVKFSRGPDQITATSSGKQYIITMTLDDAGKCKLRIDDGEPLERWQVRRRLLESLVFERGRITPSIPQRSKDRQ